MSPNRLHRFRHAAAALWCAALLVACGGAGEVGSGGTGAAVASAEGTVTGYGSIFVDGARFDDSNARVTRDLLDGSDEAGETQLGQRVAVGFEVDGVAQTVRIEPELVGVVSELVAGGFKVLGQAVQVNADPAVGPVTQFDGGYAGLADVQPGHLVEVHGVARSASGVVSIQATRVEKRVAPLPYLRVTGTVANLLPVIGGVRFMLGTLMVDTTGAVLVPPGRVLANGQSVVVLAPVTGLQSGVLSATRVRIRERANGPAQGYVGGVVSNLAGDTFRIDDITVVRSTATLLSPPGRTLAEGQYVQVRGKFADDGSLAATEIRVRSGVLDADLRGTAIGYDAATQTFTVRGINVNAAAATRVECTVADLSGGYVEVSGRLGLGGVVASEVRCRNDPPSGAVIERDGLASGTVLADKTFLLATGDGPLTVRWTVLTFFRDGLKADAAPALDGKRLRVEGVLLNGVLVATKIRLDR